MCKNNIIIFVVSMKPRIKEKINPQLLHRIIERKQVQRKRLLNINVEIENRFDKFDRTISDIIPNSYNLRTCTNSLAKKRVTYEEFLKVVTKFKDSFNWGVDIRPRAFCTTNKIRQKSNSKNQIYVDNEPYFMNQIQLVSNIANNSLASLNVNKKKIQYKQIPPKSTSVRFTKFKRTQKIKTQPQPLHHRIKQLNISVSNGACRPWSRWQKNEPDQFQMESDG